MTKGPVTFWAYNSDSDLEERTGPGMFVAALTKFKSPPSSHRDPEARRDCMSIGMDAMVERQGNIGLNTFVRKRGDLIALANKVVRNHAVAEELVQDSWIQWSSKSYPNRDAGPIFSRIVLNLSFDWLRKQKREWAKIEAFSLLYDNAPDTERVVIARQELLNVMGALQKLPPRSLRAFRLSRVEEMTFAEIGKDMGLSTSTAYRLVSEALIQVALVTQK